MVSLNYSLMFYFNDNKTFGIVLEFQNWLKQ